MTRAPALLLAFLASGFSCAAAQSLPGDCDASGVVETTDALVAAQASAGLATVALGQACSVAGGPEVTVLDALVILQAINRGMPEVLALSFEDVTQASGIDHTHRDAPPIPPLSPGDNTRFGSGGAVCDYDRDGDQDLFLCNSLDHPNRLLANDGTGRFTDVTAVAGVGGVGMSHMALFLDLDGDRWDDLVVLNDTDGDFGSFPASRLYRNNCDGTFTDVSAGSGFEPVERTFGGATAGDIDGDGDLDLVLVGWQDRTKHVYRNEGAFLFREVSQSAGLQVPGTDGQQWTPLLADFDGDGVLDLFCAVDFAPDYLLRGNGDGTFTDVTFHAGVTHVANDMGTAFGDFDGDLDLDLYTTNISFDWIGDACCNALYVNDGRGRFSRGGDRGAARSHWAWGTWFFDADLDGALDLYAVNGWFGVWEERPATFFWNDGGGNFEEVGALVGLAHPGSSRALLPIDLEGDGLMDVVICDAYAPVRVLANRCRAVDRHWLVVECEGEGGNTRGVGARVTITAAGRSQMRVIAVGGSFYAGPALEAHFGLGSASVVDRVQVDFPGGRRAVHLGVPADRRLVVREAEAPLVIPTPRTGTGR